MDLEISELGEGRYLVRLSGRLDTRGVGAVESRFNAAVTASGRSSVVDLSGVEFVASMGIRMFLIAARAAAGKGARFVMFGARDTVHEVFTHAGITGIVPVAATEAGAIAQLAA
jgi:anti-anti-sigma factor